MHLSQKYKAALMLFLAAFMCSIGGVCIKLSPWQPLSINASRGLIAASITFAYIKASHKPIIINFPVILGAISLCLTMLLHVLANRITSAASAILLMYTSPIFVLVFLWIFKNKRPQKKDIICAIAVLCGVGIIGLEGLQNGNILGDIIALLSGISYAGVFLVNTGKNGNALSSYFLGQLGAGIIGVPSLLCEQSFTTAAIASALLLGVFQLGLSYILMAKGLENTAPATASIITAAEPVLSPIWVWIFLSEGMSVASIIGAVVVIISIAARAIRIQAKRTQA